MTTPPNGFTSLRLARPGSFIELNGPLFGKREGRQLIMGFWVEPRHCNPSDFCHGAMLLALADMLLGPGVDFELQTGQVLPTVSITADFLAPAPLGAWVQGSASCLRRTKNLLFTECLITADETPALRASGIVKLGPPINPKNQPDVRAQVP
jgi:acyl-coenzyme A thioesterase PaaI-like protein